MAITHNCDHCGSLLRADDHAGGREARCPTCGEYVTMPFASDGSSAGRKSCPYCAESIAADAIKCRFCNTMLDGSAGAPSLSPEVREFASKKMAAGICGILLGTFGVHKFILGFSTAGVIMLLVSLLTCFLGAPVMNIIGIIEGITYLSKSDEDFYRIYAIEQKDWF